MRRLQGLLLFVLTVGTPLSHAQEPLPQRDQTAVLTVASRLVMLDTLVETKRDHAIVQGLDRSNFELSEDGIAQPITYFGHNELPLSLVLLFDLTDTVRPALKLLAKGAFELLARLKRQDEVAIMVFSSHTELLQDFTTDRVRAGMAIDKAAHMESNEGSFVHECMYEAMDQAMRSTIPSSRRVLVWLTDGTANREDDLTRKRIGQSAPEILHTEKENVDRLQHTNIVVSELVERSSITDSVLLATAMGGTRYGELSRYANMTGGPVLQSSKKEIADRLAELLDQLSARYTLGFKPTGDTHPGTFRKLSVKLTPETFQQHPELHENDLIVTTREGYYR